MCFPSSQRVEERLELRLVGMIAHVAAIEHLHAERGPRVLVQAPEFLAVEFVVEDAALATDKVGVEVVRLETIDDSCAFADRTAGERSRVVALVWYS
jgi:hypothetical protein